MSNTRDSLWNRVEYLEPAFPLEIVLEAELHRRAHPTPLRAKTRSHTFRGARHEHRNRRTLTYIPRIHPTTRRYLQEPETSAKILLRANR